MAKLLSYLWLWWVRLLVPQRVLKLQERSGRWRKLKKAHLKREPACAACGRKTDVEVHHIVPVSVDPDRELDPHNLITLCATPCHFVFGHFFCYHCYNKNVRHTVALFRKAMQQRVCHERLGKKT